MMEKAYSLFFCILLISVLFLPSTAAARALRQTAQTEGEGGYHGGNDGNKIGVTGSHSKTASSRTGSSSPSEPTPVRQKTFSDPRKPAVACAAGKRYSECLPRNTRSPAPCTAYKRNCK